MRGKPADIAAELPRDVVAAVGLPATATRVGGAGGPGSFRVEGPQGTVFYKRAIHPRELEWHRRAQRKEAALAAAGCWTAPLVASGAVPAPWVALGWAGSPWPQERWGGTEMLAALAAWHRAAPIWQGPPEQDYAFSWDAALTRDALAACPAGSRADLRAQWQDLAAEAALRLFGSEVSAIHGDPNPTNWVVAPPTDVPGAGDRLVLLDWSRAGRAHPAVDVAIALPGLPSPERAARAAAAYLAARGDGGPGRAAEWAGLILKAKLWSAVEFLAMATRRELSADAASGLAMLRQSLPRWCAAALH